MVKKKIITRPTTLKKRKPFTAGQAFQLEIKTRSSLETKAIQILKKLQVPFEYENKDKKVAYTKPATSHKYLPDIIIGDVIYELKGYWSDKDKMVHIKNSNPDLKFVMVFQKDQPIRKGSKTLYSDFCNKNGIKWMLFKDFEANIMNTQLKITK